MYCHQCGTSADASALFCSKCGATLKNDDSIHPTVAPVPPQASQNNADYRVRTQLAERGTRFGAAALDLLMAIACMIPGVAVMSFSDSDGGKLFGGILIAAGFLGLLIVQMVLLVNRGQSLGKRVMGIKIVKVSDESAPGFVKVVLLRMWVPGLIGGIPYVGVVMGLVDSLFIFRDDRRCLHDLIADTKVINGDFQEQRQVPTLNDSSGDQATPIDEALAQKRASRKVGWYIHCVIYVVVSVGLALLSVYTGRHPAIIPPAVWGLALLIHGIVVFVAQPGNNLRERLLDRERKRLQG